MKDMKEQNKKDIEKSHLNSRRKKSSKNQFTKYKKSVENLSNRVEQTKCSIS
jgi:hypothetical protein